MVVRDEAILCIFLFLFAVVSCSFVGESSRTIQEFCSTNRYIYNLEPEESYQLKLTSNSSSGQINKWYQKSKRRCRKEFKTNNGASHFSIVISNMSIASCSENCHCNYFEIAEADQEKKYCGVLEHNLYFETKNGYLSIEFHHTLSMQFDVTLTFSVRRNTYIITGVPKANFGSGHFLETPYFPELYQFDYIAEYVLRSDHKDGHVMLMFLDFQIAPGSSIEVVGHNGTHPARYFGDIFRPPVFVSQENQLNLRFQANSQVKSGFRAVCFFIRDADLEISKPYTNCGGNQEQFGGLLTIGVNANYDYYDCVWHIPSNPAIKQNSRFLSISNITFKNLGPNSSLEFREGLNSKSKLVKSIDCNDSNCTQIPTEITIQASAGLYIRFNGHLNLDSVFEMIFGTYHNGNCSEEEILCNEKCFLSALRCDGIKHCSNGIDEQECSVDSTILETTQHPTTKILLMNSNNFNITALVMLATGVCGLVIFILLILIAMYKYLTPPFTEEYEQQVSSEMTGPLPNVCSRISRCFDQPPSYEDFIQSSDCYPPLIYTRAAKRNSEPFCNMRTTSFSCNNAFRPRIPSTCDNQNFNLDNNSSSEESVFFPQPSCSFGRNNVEWTFDKSLQKNQISNSLKRAISFDSNLNKKSNLESCHVHVSITHSLKSQACIPKHHSLPTHFKINELKSNEIDITFQTFVPGMLCHKKRKFSSCLICQDSLNARSEIMTNIKARCFSDPS
ncbi:uncharacterized protein CDAR_21001 [Caerostris darwini]|uniref:CUB domain-containing protein n=1 Tax=Caerostris darwini TaxID=1538125 RepID=A0AAV4TQS7_9ARAC|nr:uncharacterized protein CDAR_21001 [Caerostris darwini]